MIHTSMYTLIQSKPMFGKMLCIVSTVTITTGTYNHIQSHTITFTTENALVCVNLLLLVGIGQEKYKSITKYVGSKVNA